MRDIIHLTTQHREELVDITARVAAIVKASGVRQGVAAVYAGRDRRADDPGKLG